VFIYFVDNGLVWSFVAGGCELECGMSVQQAEGRKATDRDLPEAGDKAAFLKVSDGVDLKDVIGILFRRKRWIFGVTAAFCALAAGYVVLARPAYTATAQVYVDPRDRPTPKDPKEEQATQNSVPGDGLLLVESQLKIITSDEVLTRVVDEMNLRNDPEFNRQGGLGSQVKALFGFGQSSDPALTALRNLRLRTTAKRNDRSFVIDILASADTPERATRITNAVANAYLEEQTSSNASFNRRISEAINSQLERMRNTVSQSEQAVTAYRVANNLVGARNRLVTEQELDEANTQLNNAKTRLSEAQARVKLIGSIEAGGTPLDALPEAIQSGTIVQLRARAADASREEAQLAQINGPNHPTLLAAQAQVRNAQIAIKDEVKLIAQAVRNAETSERTNVQNLQARFDTLKTLSQTNEKAIVPLRELERKADADRAVYETFLAKAKNASEQQVIDTTNIRLISRASPPERKSWPPTTIMMAAALFGGLTLGIVMALTRETLSARDRVPPKPGGVPPQANGGRINAAANPAPRSLLRPAGMSRREQISRLSTELLTAPAGHSILLVRASADDSLSLVALELARAVEEAGKNAVVIDADMTHHFVTSRLHFDKRLGFRDFLAGSSSIREAVHVLGKTNISIVPVGLAGLTSPDHRARGAFSAVLKAVRAFDRIIVDGGEMGAMSSGHGLYAMTDQVIFLGLAQSDRADDVLALVDLLRHCRIDAKAVFLEPNREILAA
jgi:polysaccharide biosynthesis transport protein